MAQRVSSAVSHPVQSVVIVWFKPYRKQACHHQVMATMKRWLPDMQTQNMHSIRQSRVSCQVQDPTRRPTAEGLLQHGFLQRVRAPPSLQQTISAHAAKRAPLDQHSHQVAEYQQTMPRWNFGTENAAPEKGAAHPKKGTLRSHQINMTFKDDGTVRHNTIPRHPSLAMMAQLAQAGLVSNCCSNPSQHGSLAGRPAFAHATLHLFGHVNGK